MSQIHFPDVLFINHNAIFVRKELNTKELLLFENIYRQYFKIVYNFAIYLCHEQQLAEDLTSEGFMQLTHYLDKGEINYKSLLFKIVHNRFIDHVRKNKKQVILGEFDTVSEQASFEEQIIANEEQQQVQSAMHKLRPSIYQEVLLLRYKFELEYSEIAGILGKEETTVRKIKERALAKLKQILKP